MPGKVVRVLVRPGGVVKAGQTLVIMESMKMETDIAAPMDGVVETVRVNDGDVVAQGDLLVTIIEGD